MKDRFHVLSLGSSTTEALEQTIKTSMAEGHWVLLQNCHLALDWVAVLDKELASANADSIHVDFRLWLTSKSIEGFPVCFLMNYN
jgi:dynein heavy chain